MFTYAITDLRSALRNLSGWSYLAAKRIQLENRRTLLGSLWIILGFGVPIFGIAILMAQLQGRPFAEHVPYVMFGFAGWNFIAGSVTAGCNVMLQAKPYLLQMKVARSVFPLSLTLRNFYLLILQFLTAAIVVSFLGWRPSVQAGFAILAILLYLPTSFFTGLLLGMLCVQFRDLGRLVEALIRLMFFFTPVIWAPGTRDAAMQSSFLHFLATWNPFAYALRAFRSGLLGEVPSSMDWMITASISLILIFSGLLALQFLGRRVTYWL